MTSMVRKNRLPGGGIGVVQQAGKKRRFCTSRPQRDDRLRLFGAQQLGLAAVARHGAALQIPLLHQTIHVHRHKVRLDLADLHDIPGCGAVRVVGQKHQDIKGGLGSLSS